VSTFPNIHKSFDAAHVLWKQPAKGNKLFILCGPSGSGKSTLVAKIEEDGFCKRAPKYSNRAQRVGQVNNLLHVFVKDDIIHKNYAFIKEHCDIKYSMYNNFYGIQTKKIKKILKANKCVIVISNIQALKKVKEAFIDTEIIFILVDNICIRNLLTAYATRERLQIFSEDTLMIADNLSNAISKNNIKKIRYYLDLLKDKMKAHFAKKEYKEFVKRLEGWIYYRKEFAENKELFTQAIQGGNLCELYEKLIQRIKKS